MKSRLFKRGLVALAIVAALGAATGPARAQTGGDPLEQRAGEIDRTTGKAPNRAASSMAKEFSGVVGSEADARKLVDGLRNGTPVTLDGGQTTVKPASGTGYGNVFISLALTQASLAESGNNSPTATQFSTTLNEVLAKRASGMGWGQIAKEMDLKLGQVVSSVKSGNQRLEASLKARDAREKGADKGSEPTKRNEKAERPDKPGRPDKPDRPEKSMRP